ncbi:MAG: XRE family transcriptional regulator [Cyclobacteriaceae bacterium]
MSRLKDLFSKSGFSIRKLAKVSEIPEVKLKNLFEGFIDPSMSDLRKLSIALEVPISYLISESSNDVEKVKVLFRNEIKSESSKYEVDKFSFLIGNSLSLLQGYVPDSTLINYFDRVHEDYASASILAIKFRELYCEGDQLGPLFTLPYILENKLKCIVYVTEIGADGASAYINNVPFIFISPRFEGRMLFTCAHELAHILTHLKRGSDTVHYDENIFDEKRNRSIEEKFANAFAANLLMPEQGVAIALKKIRSYISNNLDSIGDVEILYLSRLYGVSFESASMRLETLNLIPKGATYSLSKEINSKFKSAEKRADNLGLPPRERIVFPKVSASLVANAIKRIQDGSLSIGKASEMLSLSVQEIISQNVRRFT